MKHLVMQKPPNVSLASQTAGWDDLFFPPEKLEGMLHHMTAG